MWLFLNPPMYRHCTGVGIDGDTRMRLGAGTPVGFEAVLAKLTIHGGWHIGSRFVRTRVIITRERQTIHS